MNNFSSKKEPSKTNFFIDTNPIASNFDVEKAKKSYVSSSHFLENQIIFIFVHNNGPKLGNSYIFSKKDYF